MVCFPLRSDKVKIVLQCSVKDVMLFQHCKQAINSTAAVHGVYTGGIQMQIQVSSNMFLCPRMSDKPIGAEILECCHSQQCKSLTTV
jgi:hypothetical protein